MKILIVEDEYISRQIMQDLLARYGDCDTAVTGAEAVEAFEIALKEGKKYDLVCLDIMLPEMDGQTVLNRIRNIEENFGIRGLQGTKIIMTTALNDFKNINKAFVSQCEAYLVKPIDPIKLKNTIKELGLI